MHKLQSSNDAEMKSFLVPNILFRFMRGKTGTQINYLSDAFHWILSLLLERKNEYNWRWIECGFCWLNRIRHLNQLFFLKWQGQVFGTLFYQTRLTAFFSGGEAYPQSSDCWLNSKFKTGRDHQLSFNIGGFRNNCQEESDQQNDELHKEEAQQEPTQELCRYRKQNPHLITTLEINYMSFPTFVIIVLCITWYFLNFSSTTIPLFHQEFLLTFLCENLVTVCQTS